ncbi:DUF2293 domain-containing protein [Blastochloris viridis]|uniref:DUF2293 domain-containing protein n=1 Tax=Blastochloris viridis TaxID=1079 RepID=A0A0H5B8M0_BLAVI|nr:DUF2293 domain-containing protein [Blastochloris viridis]ALK08177.1 hypothetical protein BVIR_379 [Blastochloris viridis]BAR98557.1 hypothetical protein BV133_964 [Blastochloris viridis]CUU44099.1 hypothetical protein BVIRIDIS_31460 [Blastochloris viridis]
MTAGTKRQRTLRKALRELLPLVPLADAEAIFQRALSAPGLRGLPPTIAVWLAATSHIRHRYTDYDALLADGYDRDAARYFVADPTNETLTTWGATRLVDPLDEDGAD